MGPGVAKQTTHDNMKSRILEIAVEAFGDEGTAQRWLREPNIQLGNRLPIDHIANRDGFKDVETILYQIQYAVIG